MQPVMREGSELVAINHDTKPCFVFRTDLPSVCDVFDRLFWTRFFNLLHFLSMFLAVALTLTGDLLTAISFNGQTIVLYHFMLFVAELFQHSRKADFTLRSGRTPLQVKQPNIVVSWVCILPSSGKINDNVATLAWKHCFLSLFALPCFPFSLRDSIEGDWSSSFS